MKKEQKFSLSQLLEFFPEIELPITLAEDDHHTFSQNNKALPKLMIEQYFVPLEKTAPDDFTEYIPCFRIPETGNFTAIVYWKASLMTYEYILLTFDKKGKIIDKKTIAGTKAEGQALARSVATITEDWEIYMVGGVVSANDDSYDPANSQSVCLELLPTGEIVVTN